MKSLKSRFVVIMSFSIIFISASLLCISFILAQRALVTAANEANLQSATDISKVIDSKIDMQLLLLDNIARRQSMKDSTISISDKVNELVEYVSAGESNGVLRYGIADLNGKTLMTNGATSDVSTRDYFKAGLSGKSFATTPMMAKSDQAWIIIYSTPLYDESNTLFGVLYVVTRGDYLCEIISSFITGNIDRVWVVDSSGTTIADADFSKVTSSENALTAVTDGTESTGLASIIQQSISTPSGISEYVDENKKGHLVAFYTDEERNWTYIVSTDKEKALESISRMRTFIAIITNIVLFINVLMVYFYAGIFVKPIVSLKRILDMVADGDLQLKEITEKEKTTLLKRKDEFGQMAKTVENLVIQLANVIKTVKESATDVASKSTQIRSTSEDMSTRTSEQAAATEEITASLSDVAESVRQNAVHTNTTAELAKKAVEDTNAGGKAINETVDSMKKIVDQIAVIEKIATQTNLLALNAAIEAARAGEAGKGFAVVAGEVRKLAENCQQSAMLITSISATTGQMADSATQKLASIIEEVEKTEKLIDDINTVNRDQDVKTREISTAVSTMNNVVQQNAALSEELSTMAEELNAQSVSLEEAISFFHI